MIDMSGTVKVTDYGLATLRTNVWDPASSDEYQTAEDAILGTPDYMAPEQFQNASKANERADVYSLGCTLYKLLTGRAPFNTSEPKTLFTKMKDHLETEPVCLQTLRGDIPNALNQLVNHMLVKDPSDRTASATEVAKRIEPFCEGAKLSELVARANSMTPEYTAVFQQYAPVVNNRYCNRWVWFGGIGVGIVLTLLSFAAWYHFGIASNGSMPENPSAATTKNVAVAAAKEWILDDTDAELISQPGTQGWQESSMQVGYGGSHTYNEFGAETARWTFSVSPGAYSTYLTWPELGADQCAESVVISLYDGSELLSATRINQRNPPANVRVVDCGWALIGRINITDGPLVVEVNTSDSRGPGAIRLDAVRVIRDAKQMDP